MNSIQQKENAKPAVHREEFLVPNVDIFETNDGYVLEAEMPGVNKDGLEITVHGTEITLTGRRANVVPQGVALVAERRSADFRRSFELDPATDSSRISAKMNQGVLTLSLPKSERVKPRKIQVTAEN